MELPKAASSHQMMQTHFGYVRSKHGMYSCFAILVSTTSLHDTVNVWGLLYVCQYIPILPSSDAHCSDVGPNKNVLCTKCAVNANASTFMSSL